MENWKFDDKKDTYVRMIRLYCDAKVGLGASRAWGVGLLTVAIFLPVLIEVAKSPRTNFSRTFRKETQQTEMLETGENHMQKLPP